MRASARKKCVWRRLRQAKRSACPTRRWVKCALRRRGLPLRAFSRGPPLPGSKKTTNATKMLPKIGLKALGHKGFKIGSIWDGYQNATSGTFRHEKRRFFMLFTRFSQDIFACKRCDTELNWSEKPPKTSGYGRTSRKKLPILKLVAKI